LASWGQWDAAIPYLERAAGARPADLETGLLLAAASHRVNRGEAARAVLARLSSADPSRLSAYRRLTDQALGAEAWAQAFGAATGVDHAWLAQALAQEFEAEDLVLKAGRHRADAGASSDRSVVFDRSRDAPGVLVNGPFVFHQPVGTYVATVRLRAWDRTGTLPVGVVRAYGESRLLAERTIARTDLGSGVDYVEVVLPYVHDRPHDRVAFQIEATGAASLAVDRIRITPDVRASLQSLLAPALAPP
jgi:hypothetical protein